MTSKDIVTNLSRLFFVLQEKAPELLPAARWVMVSSELAARAVHDREPTEQELDTLAAILEREEPDLNLFLRKLLRKSMGPGQSMLAEMLLDVLLAAEKWNHPAEIVLLPPLDSLLKACQGRLQRRPRDPGMKRRLYAARKKLTKAKELADRARQRRAGSNREDQL